MILIFKWKLVSLSELFLAKLCLSVHVLVIFHNYIKTPLLEPSFLYSFLKFKVSKSVKTVEIKSSQQLSTLLDISRQKVNKNPNAMSQSIWTHCDMARFGNNPPSWWCTTMSGIAGRAAWSKAQEFGSHHKLAYYLFDQSREAAQSKAH